MVKKVLISAGLFAAGALAQEKFNVIGKAKEAFASAKDYLNRPVAGQEAESAETTDNTVE